MIGILGGMGPQAGVDLASRIVAETDARIDQEHITTFLYSPADRIPDRTAFLMDSDAASPVSGIADGFFLIEQAGAVVAGMACNTAHAPPIFDAVREDLRSRGSGLQILHLIDETVSGIRRHYPGVSRIGILGTRGTFRFRLYDDRLEAAGLMPIVPQDSTRSGPLNDAIYHPQYGLKAQSSPASSRARAGLVEAIEALVDLGAEAVILGCTELPLAVPERTWKDTPVIDPARFLARALIRAVREDRLKPWHVE